MAVLMIGAAEREKIAEIIAYAKAFPLPLSLLRQGSVDDTPVLKLEDRKPGTVRPQSAGIIFPGGYRAMFSIEEQPAGFCSHLSISVEGRAKKGMMPSEPAVQMIAEEFGMPYPADKMWIEEFEPGEFAVNLLSLHAPTKEGNA
jgi:hypothetical protein